MVFRTDKIIAATTPTMAAAASPSPYSLSPSSSPTASLSPSGSPKTNTAAATTASATTTAPPSPPSIIVSPCAACKILRRRCVDICVLAPYFPPSEPLKFSIAHKVFGASNIIKMLQELPEHQRADAVSSMVYEANSRIRDPVYGCAGAVCQLQKQISEIQAELAKAQAEMLNLQCQNDNLKSLIILRGMEISQEDQDPMLEQHDELINCQTNIPASLLLDIDDANLYATWDPALWP